MDLSTIQAQLAHTLDRVELDLPGERQIGKVREAWSREGRRLIVTTDRVSAFDRVLATIPFKGQVLNQLALFWFEHTRDLVPNHVLSVPDPNAIVVMDLEPLKVEMVVRGYITGNTSTSAWTHYQKGVREFCGNRLPDGLRKDQQLAAPIVTPSTKAAEGAHDESVSPEEIVRRGDVPAQIMADLVEISLALYRRGVELAARQGVILVDTKYEFGLDAQGRITLMDEIHTPDSSRYWYADSYQELFERGAEQRRIDKDHLRTWLADRGFLGDGELPPITDEVRVSTAHKYIEAFEAITGHVFEAEPGPVAERLKRNLTDY
ncbi:MAG: phosphoribosylaminoimidazolesuccinocarboxamide synthase [Candidatus Delongbacteria bacterium]